MLQVTSSRIRYDQLRPSDTSESYNYVKISGGVGSHVIYKSQIMLE